MNSYINNKRIMAEKIKDKLMGSMVRYRNTSAPRTRSSLNPNAVNTPASLTSTNNTKNILEKKRSKGKLEYELRILVGHAMVLDRLVEEIDRADHPAAYLDSDCETVVEEQQIVVSKVDESDESESDSDEELTYNTYTNSITDSDRYFSEEDVIKLNMRQQKITPDTMFPMERNYNDVSILSS